MKNQSNPNSQKKPIYNDYSDKRKNRRQARAQIIDLTADDDLPKKKPSIYMQEIIRLNLIDFVRKYKQHQVRVKI